MCACVPISKTLVDAHLIEVVRTRMREAGSTKYNSLWRSFKVAISPAHLPDTQVIFVEEGVRGLYAGMPAHLLRVVPNSAFMFLTYELVVKAYQLHAAKYYLA